MAKRKEEKNIIDELDINVEKLRLILFYISAAGGDISEVNKKISESINKTIDKIYLKAVPKSVRELLNNPSVTVLVDERNDTRTNDNIVKEVTSDVSNINNKKE